MSRFCCLNLEFEKKNWEIYFEFSTLDKIHEITAHVVIALCQPVILHVGLALFEILLIFHDIHFLNATHTQVKQVIFLQK